MEHSKKLTVLRLLLQGRGYHEALRAMEFAKGYHTGLRKDGKTPEFDHQLSLALFAMNLPDVREHQVLIATVFTHDLSEDYDITDGEIRGIFMDPGFAAKVARATDNLTKTYRGVKKDKQALFEAMGKDPTASLAKGVDRTHNKQTMVGVFSYAKQVEYIDETENDILPMLKRARRNFPEQAAAYEMIKHILLSQIELIRHIHAAAGHVMAGQDEPETVGAPAP